MASFLAKMAHQTICRHAGGAKELAHLQLTKADSWHQYWCRLYLEHQLHRLATIRELKVPKSKVCHLDICIYILLFPALNFSIMIHIPRIASTIKIVFQICWLMKEHPPVNMLLAEWKCSWHPFCRREQPTEWTYKWRRALINRNTVLSVILSTISRHFKVYFKGYIYMYYQRTM